MEFEEEVVEGDETGKVYTNRSRIISASNPRTSIRSSSGEERIGTGVEKPTVENVRR